MKRLGICIFYDPLGIVDCYLEILLESFKEVLDELHVIVNGIVQEDSRVILEKYADRIVIRENLGLDGGAYKDYFLKEIERPDLKRFDEIVIFNDTFYGPVFPWKKYFDAFEKEEVDFWGLTRHPGGTFGEGREFGEHIQAYFLAVRNQMFMSENFYTFWEKLSYPNNHQEAVENFEIAFTQYFGKSGYTYKAWTDLVGFTVPWGDNPFSGRFLFALTSVGKVPIIKKKIMNWSNFEEVYKLYDYVEANSDYDMDALYDNLRRIYREGRTGGLYDFFQLEDFYNNHKKIYVYGKGKISKSIVNYFKVKNWNIAAFVVSDGQEKDKDTLYISELKLDKDDGLIIALGKRNYMQIQDKLSNYTETQVLYPFL